MLIGLRAVYLVESKDLLFGVRGGRCWGSSGRRACARGRTGGGVYGDLSMRSSMNDGALKTSGNGYCVLACGRPYTQRWRQRASVSVVPNDIDVRINTDRLVQMLPPLSWTTTAP